ncbi:hypothetical protein [Saccharopolyspora shandongensis]|uniref:hypothetical protein n=1 Tax=Saccharopolyspora shandongensis TaxID=418495 RepID=UPI0033E4495A
MGRHRERGAALRQPTPEGSINHELSKLPVTIQEWPQDLLIELPWQATERSGHRVVVVPIEFRRDSRPEGEEKALLRKRHSGHWACAVVSSDHPSYPVGGRRLSISAAELARGKRIELTGDSLDVDALEARIRTPELAQEIAA